MFGDVSGAEVQFPDRGIQSAMPGKDKVGIVAPGKLVFERYFNGFGPDDRHSLYSVTKQWLPCLVGAVSTCLSCRLPVPPVGVGRRAR